MSKSATGTLSLIVEREFPFPPEKVSGARLPNHT